MLPNDLSDTQTENKCDIATCQKKPLQEIAITIPNPTGFFSPSLNGF